MQSDINPVFWRKFVRFFILFLFIFGVTNIFAKSNIGLSSAEISNLSNNRLQMLRRAYIEFLIDVEKTKYKYPHKLQKQVHYTPSKIEKFYLKIDQYLSAYAASGDICFFGGWPSRMEGAICKSPWKHNKDQQLASEFGDLYTSESYCGSSNKFRCNPLLFGAPDSSPKGLCVNTGGSYIELTEKCEKASKDNISSLIKKFQDDENYQQHLSKMGSAIETFCGKYPKYDACDNLRNRIGDITGESVVGSEDVPLLPSKYATPDKVLKACSSYLKNNEVEDIYGILSSFEKGVENCYRSDIGDSQGDTSFLELRNEFKELDKFNYLDQLNRKKFKYISKSLLISSYAYGEGISPKEIKKEIEKRFPLAKSEYKNILDDLFREVNASDIPRVSFENEQRRLKAQTQKLDRMCEEINIAQGYNPEGANLYNVVVTKEIEQSIQGPLSPLFGTEVFQDKVYDPSVNYGKECFKDENHKIINPDISKKDYQNAVKEAEDKLLGELKGLKKASEVLSKGKLKNIEEEIEDYIKYDRPIVVDVMLQSPRTEIDSMSAYLCEKTLDISKDTKRRDFISKVGLGASLVGGVACAFPVTALVGCPLLAAGVASEGYAGGKKIISGSNVKNQALFNQLLSANTSSGSTSDNLLRAQAGSRERVEGGIDLGVAAGGAVVGTVGRVLKAGSKTVKGASSVGKGSDLAMVGKSTSIDTIKKGSTGKDITRSSLADKVQALTSTSRGGSSAKNIVSEFKEYLGGVKELPSSVFNSFGREPRNIDDARKYLSKIYGKDLSGASKQVLKKLVRSLYQKSHPDKNTGKFSKFAKEESQALQTLMSSIKK